MAMSKKAMDFRKSININASEEESAKYWDNKRRKLDYEEYSGKTGMTQEKNISIEELEKIDKSGEEPEM